MRALLSSSIGVVCSAALLVPLASTAAAVNEPRQPPGTQAAQRPADTRSLPLTPLDPGATADRAGGAATELAGAKAGLTRRTVEPFSLLGMVWENPEQSLHGHPQVRTRDAATGAWSDWQDLSTHTDDAPDPGSAERRTGDVKGSTAPLWVGPSDGVAVRVLPSDAPGAEHGTGHDTHHGAHHDTHHGTDTASAELPAGLRLELVDPGTGPGAPAPGEEATTPKLREGDYLPPQSPQSPQNAEAGTTDADAGTTDADAGTTDADAGTTDAEAGTTDAEAGTGDAAPVELDPAPTASNAAPTAPEVTASAGGIPEAAPQQSASQADTGTGPGSQATAVPDRSLAPPAEPAPGVARELLEARLAGLGSLSPVLAEGWLSSLPEDASGAEEAMDNVGPRPGIVTRRGWGADESLRESQYLYTRTVKAAFVHHTAMSNGYACSEAPAVIRSIYRYHVKSLGWRDVGYNFFVDKCGKIYEGRAGGVRRAVMGAHTYGFNSNTTGVAVLGSYGAVAPSKAAREGVAKLLGWKLGIHRAPHPNGSVTLTSGGGKYPKGRRVTLKTISGHRDGFNTACPGDKLYAALPSIRALAARLQGR
ncbi:N-acetylmuramoyl-L-alanine amidase [Streptomyces sp. JJ66]|uniref:N-acetylmuramoyl-L-alanine amidase n=1 Tax=Streptomyces sp. JJ66 TaxID=2803843 RepID=UPI001C56A867|nr:N-acetylmuramoyl-L-alanine amidase [Streptomyces sp. JJ66]MBW1601852.1 N-acetylmuramoyl-L-alanine amidase [Streptomyces sp. JJ66]